MIAKLLKSGPARRAALGSSLLGFCISMAYAADIDIYGPSAAQTASSNVLLFFDNTSNWSAANNRWDARDVYNKCKVTNPSTPAQVKQEADCKAAIISVFGPYKPNNRVYPWESGNSNWGPSTYPTQGEVQLQAMKFVLNDLICKAGLTNPLSINIGLSMFNGTKGTVLSNGHPTSVIYHAVQNIAPGGSCTAILGKLDQMLVKIQDNAFKAPSDANYSAALYEAFKYFGGYTNPTLTPTDTAGSPVSRSAYGTGRFGAVATALDDPAAFTDTVTRLNYKPPISDIAQCGGKNFLILIGNTYPNAEPNNGGPVRFQNFGYTPPSLSASSSDVNRFADEWAYFLQNTDVNAIAGIQTINTYTVNVFNQANDPAQAKLLKSMAQVGSQDNVYIEVGGDLLKLINEFKDLFLKIAAVDSVFTATTLPVSTTTQGTFLNQVFVGTFQPDADFRPRWIGNLKQYQIGRVNDNLELVDANSNIATSLGFFAPQAQSIWTRPSVFFTENPIGVSATPASDSPDGPYVIKGGAAQRLREANLDSAASRKVLTLSGSTVVDFNTTNNLGLSSALVNWLRGENNVLTDADGHRESFNGSKATSATTTAALAANGARASMHGDILHSRPTAINYGIDEVTKTPQVVVFYGTNHGMLHAVDGSKTSTNGGNELWAFLAPEFAADGRLNRLRSGTLPLLLPENGSDGTLLSDGAKARKGYGMDGPIGVYTRYQASPLSNVFYIYPTMRRGGRTVYGFDVSNKNTPVNLWRITGGSTTGYEKLGQTWSLPSTFEVQTVVGGDGVVGSNPAAPAPIIVMGGGYDAAAEDTKSPGTTTMGNIVYVIDGRTGRKIASFDTVGSVPSDLTLVDVNKDGRTDRAYFADVRGNLYRLLFPTSGDLMSAATWTNASTGGKLATIATLGNKVFFPPDVVLTKNYAAILVGTGDREKPLLNTTSDKFFLIKDGLGLTPPITTALTVANLAQVGSVNNDTMVVTPTTPPEGAENAKLANGCFISLATAGEKVINAPLTVSGVTFFGTNRPPRSNANVCVGNLGEAFAYRFPLFCDPNNQLTSTAIEGGGLIPSPVSGVVLLDDGTGTEVPTPFLIGAGTGGSPFKVEDPKPGVPPRRRPLFWRIDNTSR